MIVLGVKVLLKCELLVVERSLVLEGGHGLALLDSLKVPPGATGVVAALSPTGMLSTLEIVKLEKSNKAETLFKI